MNFFCTSPFVGGLKITENRETRKTVDVGSKMECKSDIPECKFRRSYIHYQ